ncbi:conserved hypothetical protein [Vibrio atlanticus]|uniref:Uncharacterized protein n=3 Tax=Vibrio TaxID=662 RepID=B7VS31_VIBA3|nr:conserved hypothetical protein [Vibrio atlanticus]
MHLTLLVLAVYKFGIVYALFLQVTLLVEISMDKKDWLDAVAVVGWVSVWSALVYLIPTAGL